MEQEVIERISGDSNLAPFMARTQFKQMRQYFEQYLGLKRDVGQMTFLAVSADTPPGRPIAQSKRVAITLAMDSVDGLEALRHGVGAVRRSKIQRLMREAQEQGTLLTQDAWLACCAQIVRRSSGTLPRCVPREWISPSCAAHS